VTHQLCPNCQAEIKTSFLSENLLIGEERVDFINKYTKNLSSGFCFKCYKDLLKEALSSYKSHESSLNALIKSYSEQIIVNLFQ
jgi:predicted amidophosphoribosyltransferase